MTPPAVSVLMPVLNPHAEYLAQAVASILGQTFCDWELVIVEDPSPASAAAVLARFDDPRIRLIANPTRTGLVAQRNRTLAEARASLVAMLDADDVAEPDRLARQVALLTARPEVALVGCQLQIIDHAGATLGYRTYPTEHDAILRAMPRYNAIPQPGVMVRKDAILRRGGYRLEWPAEDYDLWSRMLIAGERAANLDEPLTRYRVHRHSGSKSTHVRQLLDLTAAVKRRYWWARMTMRDRWQYRGELALRFVPAGMAYRLFAALTYRRSLRGRSPG